MHGGRAGFLSVWGWGAQGPGAIRSTCGALLSELLSGLFANENMFNLFVINHEGMLIECWASDPRCTMSVGVI